MTAIPPDPFLAALREYRLLDPARLAELDAWAAQATADPQEVAREAVRRGWVTEYQVKELSFRRGRQLVLGPYVLLDLIGEGGMGRVYKARHTRLGRDVALKVIRKEKLTKGSMLPRFRQEIQAAGKVSHPNVVLALDADEADGVHYYAMEYVEGTDLTRLVKDRGPLPIPMACDYVRQAALGLQHAADQGLVHRDVKPSNLLVTPRGQIKVLDLGLAMLNAEPGGEDANRVTQEGLIVGTPDFLAPEQATNPTGVDTRADVYALGASLFFLLAGRVPYPGASPADKLLQHVTAPPPDLLKHRPDAPPQLAALIQWMMAKRPEDRPQSPAQAAYALAPFCPPAPGSGAVAVPPGYPAPAVSTSPTPSGWPSGVAPMPARPVVAAPYLAPAVADPFAFAEAPAATAVEDRPRRTRSVRRPAGSGNGLKWAFLGLVGLAGIAAVLGLGYVLVGTVAGVIQGEAPPPPEFAGPAGIPMVHVPAGSFSMGSPETEPGRSDDEGPAGEVTLSSPFYMAATEVTHGQWVEVMGAAQGKWPPKLRQSKLVPVDSVTWDQANEFCQKLNQRDRTRRAGWAYRLPTEAEWEYACRAGTTGPFWCGDKLTFGRCGIFDLKRDEADKNGLGEADAATRPMEKLRLPYPVGRVEADRPGGDPIKPAEPNKFGLYDTHGNVWEWCQDRYAPAYGDRPATDPKGPDAGDWRVLRGGSWKEPAARCRSAARRGLPPNSREEDVGFRVVFALQK